MQSLGGAVPERLCEDCTEPWDWSHDGHYLLFSAGEPLQIGLMDVGARAKILLLQHPGYRLHGSRFSSDDRWIAFSAEKGVGRTLFVAPFHGMKAIPDREWIALTDGSTFTAPAGWSPDDRLVFFMSDRDGFRCLWSQRVDARTKQPVGQPIEVYPFHSRRGVVDWTLPGALGTSLRGDKFTFSLGETTGNIWMTERAQ